MRALSNFIFFLWHFHNPALVRKVLDPLAGVELAPAAASCCVGRRLRSCFHFGFALLRRCSFDELDAKMCLEFPLQAISSPCVSGMLFAVRRYVHFA